MLDVGNQIAALDRMTTGELVGCYKELHGQPCRTRHRAYLLRKIAWRIQANAEGGLTERARKRAEELANDADVRVMAPKTMICPPQVGETVTVTVTRQVPMEEEKSNDPRMPPPGAALVRQYKGRTIRAVVLEDGQSVEWDGERFRSLSALANRITRSHMSGFRFFHLGVKR
ncbi:MAG: DUF2924 domain-containing protein [Phycisphaerales bacterium]|nr:DUF2924 domain-containing protein [Phycisphaerales bacterium]